MISENKLFHERLRDELTGIAEFIFGWRGRNDLIILFPLAHHTTK